MLRVEAARKAGDDKRRNLKDSIDRKLEHADEKREARLSKIQDRIRIHVRTHLIRLLSVATTKAVGYVSTIKCKKSPHTDIEN